MRKSLVLMGFFLLAAGGLAAYLYRPNGHAGGAKAAERHVAGPSEEKTEAPSRTGNVRNDEPSDDEIVARKSRGERRTTTQPGSIIPDKSAELYAKVSGYLKELGTDLDGKPIDIGSRVKKDQVLAVIHMPELEKEVQRDKASVKRAKATVEQMKARVVTAKADYKAAAAMLSFRTKVYKRLDKLAHDDVMDMRVVDEKEEQMHAAEETKNAAEAKILQSQADLEEALAEVDLAQATLERAQVDLEYATIRSPYSGMITVRNFWPGDFVRDADHGASKSLLAVQKTDVVRVVVQIPDVDVPYVNPGDVAAVKVFNLPGKEFHGTIARIAHAEDTVNRTMRVEIDLPNQDGHLHDGMYASVTIVLETGDDSSGNAGGGNADGDDR